MPYDKKVQKKLADLLNKCHIDYARKRGRMVSAAEFAKYLEVSNTSLSQWMNMVRLPTGSNVHKIAAKCGPQIYDIMGIPRMMPKDEKLNQIVDRWYQLSEEDQERIFNELLELTGIAENNIA